MSGNPHVARATSWAGASLALVALSLAGCGRMGFEEAPTNGVDELFPDELSPDEVTQRCAEAGAACGAISLVLDDATGRSMDLDCGTCPGGQVCDGANQCQCLQSDADFCLSHQAYCGALTAADACGFTRTVASCGDCGLAACSANQCVSSCAGVSAPSSSWTYHSDLSVTPLDGEAASHDMFFGASADGALVLISRASSVCSGHVLMLLSGAPAGSYASSAVDVAYNGVLSLVQHRLTLTPDGSALVGARADESQLIRIPVSALSVYDAGTIDYAPPSLAMANAAASAASATIYSPVFSADGLGFFYVLQPPAGAAQLFEAVRASPAEPFGPGRLLTEVESGFDFITGVSDDRLTLFLGESFRTYVTRRVHPSLPFDAVTTADPRPVARYRVMPVLGCTALLGTINSQPGCQYEDIGFSWP